jgi:hypothetical protein
VTRGGEWLGTFLALRAGKACPSSAGRRTGWRTIKGEGSNNRYPKTVLTASEMTTKRNCRLLQGPPGGRCFSVYVAEQASSLLE